MFKEIAPQKVQEMLEESSINVVDIRDPGSYSAEVGHYFANKVNRFWEALSASGLVPDPVGPEDDVRLITWGIGLTDIVKRPTGGIHEVSQAEF